jgi:hypothetical protein
MIKLKNIINENTSSRRTFTTSQQNVDNDTGQISWQVQYHPAKELEKNLIVLQEQIEKLIRNNPKDIKLIEFYDLYRRFKKSFNTHLNKQYPK